MEIPDHLKDTTGKRIWLYQWNPVKSAPGGSTPEDFENGTETFLDLTSWSHHTRYGDVHPGDIAVFWRSLSEGIWLDRSRYGVIAMGVVGSDAYEDLDYRAGSTELEWYVDLTIDLDLYNAPLLKVELETDPDFQDVGILTQPVGTVWELTPKQYGAILRRLAAASGLASPPEAGGQGYASDQGKLRQVEAGAVQHVRDTYADAGWRELADCQQAGVGYDIEFGRSGQKHCVEIKGVSGSTEDVILTPKEREFLTTSTEARLVIVVDALGAPKAYTYAGADIVADFDVTPQQYRCAKKPGKGPGARLDASL